MLKQNYEVEVLINGKAAKEYAHKGNVYIEGRKGTRFSIRIRNNSYSRKLFVPTIDGLSVMNGEEGDFNSGGYVVQGHNSITIDGWRTSNKDVASFYFSSPEGSYRRKMNKGNNLGIIGVAIFDEKYNWPHVGTTYTTTNWPYNLNTTTSGMCNVSDSPSYNCLSQQTKSMCCSLNNSGSSQEQKLGTGWGEQKTSEVTTVTFEQESYPETVFEIYYNTREELEKAGINFKKEPLYVTPQAFPGQYCKPPKN
jgi:hypothetical protein